MFLSFFATEFFAKNYLQLASYINRSNKLMSLYAAQDLWNHDIKHASDMSNDWVQRPHELICKTIEADIGWHFHNNKLYRITGDYDFKYEHWNKKSNALVSNHVDHFDYWIEKKNNRVISVQSTIALDDMEPITSVAWLSNRIIP
jgi:hypothetical protein